MSQLDAMYGNNPSKHHPLTFAYLQAVNAVIKAYNTGELVLGEFREKLIALRAKHNHGVL